MSGFFQFCVKCRKMFQSPEEWHKHQEWHAGQIKPAKRPFDEVEQRAEFETDVPGDDRKEETDRRLAKTKQLRTIKKALLAAGIECQTMTADEARAAYAEAVKSGAITEDNRAEA